MKNLRKITSLLLIFCFVFVAFSSVGLDIGHGHREEAAQWTLLGVSMGPMKSLHTIFGYLMLGLIVLHGLINMKPIINYVKHNKSGFLPSKTAAAATALSALILAFALVSGGAEGEKRKKYSAEINTENAITYYNISENNNIPHNIKTFSSR